METLVALVVPAASSKLEERRSRKLSRLASISEAGSVVVEQVWATSPAACLG